MNYYCLEHYNLINNTSLTYDEVLIEIHRCEKCGINTFCVVGLGHEHSYLVNMHYDNRFREKMLSLNSRKKYRVKRR